MQFQLASRPAQPGPWLQGRLARLSLALACSLAPTLACAQSTTATATATAIAQADAEAAETAFTQAMAHYEQSHWPQAFEALSALADQGHGEAQRIALLMWRHGPQLYGLRLQASAEQRQRWAQGQRLLTAAR